MPNKLNLKASAFRFNQMEINLKNLPYQSFKQRTE